MALQVVPLNNSPNQTYTLQLQVDGAPLTLNIAVSYSEMAGYWILTIWDASMNLLVDGCPMITGSYPSANLLQQQRYLAIGSWYIVNVSNLTVEVGSESGFGQGFFGSGLFGGQLGQSGVDWPDSTNLGTDFQLWVGDTPTV